MAAIVMARGPDSSDSVRTNACDAGRSWFIPIAGACATSTHGGATAL
ncbi:hypothetical protein BURMUCF2_1748 [Burkholderia multivorans CF2]|nr:hypothetical protein BURMUCF2_1748 [Burkholderia multivorans CF2]